MTEPLRILAGTVRPGGATCLFPVINELRRNPDVDVQVVAHGHAADVFTEHDVKFRDLGKSTGIEATQDSVQAIVEQCAPDLILTGVFGPVEGGLDFWLIRSAQQQNIVSYGVLDAWMNYAMRLADDGTGDPIAYMPDRMAVMDVDTVAELISIGVPADRLDVTGHPFLTVVRDHDQQAASRMRESLGLSAGERLVVFFSEPLRWGVEQGLNEPIGYDEFVAFDLLKSALGRADQPGLLVVKEHPRYASLPLPDELGQTRVVRSDTPAVLDLVAAADVVVGMSTTLLVYAYLMGKQVLVIQPDVCPEGDCNVLTRRSITQNLDTVDALVDALNNPSTDVDGKLSQTRQMMNWYGQSDVQASRCVYSLAQESRMRKEDRKNRRPAGAGLAGR